MSKWNHLDLRKRELTPCHGELVALRLIPKNEREAFHSNEKYEIGHFKSDERCGKKLWWYHSHGTTDPTRLKQHFDIWWCPVTPFDGY